MSNLASKNAHLADRHRRVSYGECVRQRARFPGATSAKRWAGLVAPRVPSVASSPIAAEDCTECSVELRTTKGCGLGVSRYPDFVYDAEGGGGSGKAVKLSDGRWRVHFDAAELHIPDVSFRTATLLGVPIPPPIRIEIVTDSLEGTVDRDIGKVSICLLPGLTFCDFGWTSTPRFGPFGGWGMWPERPTDQSRHFSLPPVNVFV